MHDRGYILSRLTHKEHALSSLEWGILSSIDSKFNLSFLLFSAIFFLFFFFFFFSFFSVIRR